MVLIFGGIDFPVFELLFIVSILLILGFVALLISVIYMLKGIKLMKSLIQEERANIQRLEATLGGKGGTGEDATKRYIREWLQKGVPWEQIKKTLLSRGWDNASLERLRAGIR